jgi:hypothetical protein
MAKQVKVTKETSTGRNERFVDPRAGIHMTRPQFVKAIKDGFYPDYHVRQVHGKSTPASNPDRTKGNNLG